MFSLPPAFASIPKACGFEAATHFPLILSCGSLIGDRRLSSMGMALPPVITPGGILKFVGASAKSNRLETYPDFLYFTLR
jgi:hypothetical protein